MNFKCLELIYKIPGSYLYSRDNIVDYYDSGGPDVSVKGGKKGSFSAQMMWYGDKVKEIPPVIPPIVF